MTFAEAVIFVVLALFIYLGVLRHFEPRLEKFFYRYFRARSKGKGTVIDVTDYEKRDKDEQIRFKFTRI